ncbi:MAG: peptidase C13 [Luteibacter sp.]|uniref:peptidase C13 n=1 Tax=Luteibacter sp. TaxID=1886636 RepID=UPI002808904D|nr:peptidase C13 [Luteibacter sp.]MDQ7994836.1 peptidase C13 [Luteibacter sp.]MDQ8049835.1 peptidase C13 [Luteibacter sp.]
MLLALALALATDNAFDARVHTAKMLENNAEGKLWQGRLWDSIGNPATDALKGCIASNMPAADRRPFTLVARVAADGRSSDVDVRPKSTVATCFAGQFATWTLPKPPKTPTPYPLEIDVTMD